MSTYTNVSWMTVDDHDATTGNGYVTHQCQGGYKGRVERRGYTTITTSDTTPKTKIVDFVQLPLDEYIVFNQEQYAAAKAGGSVTITGKTNSPRLGFALVDDADNICTMPTYFSIQPAGDLSPTTNQLVTGQVFTNDPGATKEIAFTLVVTIAANAEKRQRSCRIVATGSPNITAEVHVNQEQGESYIWVDEENTTTKTVTFAYNSGGGMPVDVDVLSNDHWVVNHDENVTWATMTDENTHHGDGVLSFGVANYSGRQQRSKSYQLVTDGGEDADISVVQTGVNAMSGPTNSNMTWKVVRLEQNLFTTNCQKFELTLSGTDAAHFEILSVYLTYGGQTQNISDWSGEVEPTGDPGLNSTYKIWLVIAMAEQNDTAADKVATLTCTGTNSGSATEYTWTVNLKHLHNPANDSE